MTVLILESAAIAVAKTMGTKRGGEKGFSQCESGPTWTRKVKRGSVRASTNVATADSGCEMNATLDFRNSLTREGKDAV